MSAEHQQQFRDLFNQYKSMVFQVAIGFLKGDRDLANDLLQEVFINTWIALPNFKGESSPKTWIYRITVNTCLSYLRKQKGKRQIQVHAIPENLADVIGGSTIPKNFNHLYHAIGQLESTDRLVIMMVLDEMEYADISSVLGMSEATLRVKIHRIKKRLKNIIQHG
jgi:RNA polymerase sigma factor (sigma-70 family)